MAAITRLQLIQPPPTAVKPSVLLSELHRSSVFSNSILCSARLRKLSFSPPLCSNSDSIPDGSSSSGSCPSIVGDLLDYLNESSTHFNATAMRKQG